MRRNLAFVCSDCCRYTKQRGVTDCNELTCDYVLTYRVSKGDKAHFEMSAFAGWVAVGFSSDEFMVSSCVFAELMYPLARDEQGRRELTRAT